MTVRPGTEEVTVTGVQPKDRLALVDGKGTTRVILRADRFGQAHFAYLPQRTADGRPVEFQTGAKAKLPTAEGVVVPPGSGYVVRNEDADPVVASKPFDVLGREDNPTAAWYEQTNDEIGPTGKSTEWFGYVTMRDGVQLSLTVRLPGPVSEGPYPTVVEYSGYGVSNPNLEEPGSMIAGLLGYATVGVNMRGSGCSGGVFDVFNTAQQVDGYDMIEGIARQPWVKGNEVGMVGLSYSGIAQLYVAATQPPHLSAITPLSVIKDPWLEQWPGGVYNGGFTKQWLQERDRESASTGTSWVDERIRSGDQTCRDHQQLREQNIDFEAFGRSLVHRPAQDDARDLSRLVRRIKVPVYLSGAWQDEQTGPQFGDMLGNFDQAPVTKFSLFNGRHPDGYTPLMLSRWYEFLELYVDHKVPRLSQGVRDAAPEVFASNFGVSGLTFEPDRFTKYRDDQYREVRADYESQPDVRVIFESGAGGTTPGSPVGTFEQTFATWPPKKTEARSFYLGASGTLADAPGTAGVDTFANDPASGAVDFFGAKGYELLSPTWDFDWTHFAAGDSLSYLSTPFEQTQVLGGPGHVDVDVRVPDGDADVQATLTLVRPDGTEWLVTSGLLRLSDRKVDPKRSTKLHVDRTYSKADSRPVPKGTFVTAKVSLPSFAQAFRKGDRIRVTISSPGRDFGAWAFETIGKDGTPRDVAFGEGHPSRLVVGILPVTAKVPDVDLPCPSLRGQACRPFTTG
jgi:predicted acyl esterase